MQKYVNGKNIDLKQIKSKQGLIHHMPYCYVYFALLSSKIVHAITQLSGRAAKR